MTTMNDPQENMDWSRLKKREFRLVREVRVLLFSKQPLQSISKTKGNAYMLNLLQKRQKEDIKWKSKGRGKLFEFIKKPKKSYDIENADFNQLDFPLNHLMFTFSQFILVENFKDKEEYKCLKIRFHAVLDFPLMNINDLITISIILCDVDDSQTDEDKQKDFVIRYGHIKVFNLAVIDIDLAMEINKTSNVLKSLLKVRKDLDK
ncbi:unnamed protein product [Lactuca saligna]|uniref:Uncharacterized protein n=1 Tax=Lactuca saligna TaxID=75948 RepID=A0AA35YYI5_LACSI|nr:unnamed protein product [Lactuca saligna]